MDENHVPDSVAVDVIVFFRINHRHTLCSKRTH